MRLIVGCHMLSVSLSKLHTRGDLCSLARAEWDWGAGKGLWAMFFLGKVHGRSSKSEKQWVCREDK